MTQIQKPELLDEDISLIENFESGHKISSFENTTAKFRELATGILFQFADSQMAGAAGYTNCMHWGPSLDDRIALAQIVVEKMEMARQTYKILAGQNLNTDKYFASHAWEAKVLRDADLGFRRTSWDKRLNALIYPLESWTDMAVFAHLMSSMTCFVLRSFADSSFEPLKILSIICLCVEETHEKFGEEQIHKLTKKSNNNNALGLQSSFNYWYPRVATSFGPAASARNDLHRQFHIKGETNCRLREKWTEQMQQFYRPLAIEIPDLNSQNAATCN